MRNQLLKQYFLLLLTCTLFSESTLADTFSVSFDTKGFVYGQLSRIIRIGMRNRAINGEIRLGFESSFGSTDKSTLVSRISPQLWQFCFDKDDYDVIEQLVGNYVVLQYKTPKRSSLLTCSAFNELIAIDPIVNTSLVEKKVYLSDDIVQLGGISSGVEFGRIAHAITSKHRNRTHFITLQIGNSGNQFRDYFTQDAALFDFAVQCLKMGAKVKLHFIERHTNTMAQQKNNRLHIWKIEILDHNLAKFN